jgi:hypothetical protein
MTVLLVASPSDKLHILNHNCHHNIIVIILRQAVPLLLFAEPLTAWSFRGC